MNSHHRTKLDGNSGRWPDVPTSGTWLFIQAWPLPSHRRQQDNSVIFQNLSGDRIISNDVGSRSWSFGASFCIWIQVETRFQVWHPSWAWRFHLWFVVLYYFFIYPQIYRRPSLLLLPNLWNLRGNDSGINDHILHVCVCTPCQWSPSVLSLSAITPPSQPHSPRQ